MGVVPTRVAGIEATARRRRARRGKEAMPTIIVPLGQLPALLLVALLALVDSVASGRASTRRTGLSWLDQRDLGTLGLGPVSTRDDGASDGLGGCFSGNCDGAGAPQDPRGFDADLDADLAVDEMGDNAIDAQQEGLNNLPITATKRSTLQDLIESLAAPQRGTGLYRTGIFQCSCDDGFEPHNVGLAHWPHHLNVPRCHKLNHCKVRKLAIPMLTRRPAEEEVVVPHVLESLRPHVPDSLRTHWRFDMVEIPVACECEYPEHRGK